jgi:hypothetical protein
MGVLLQRLSTKAATLDVRLKCLQWADALSDKCGLLRPQCHLTLHEVMMTWGTPTHRLRRDKSKLLYGEDIDV